MSATFDQALRQFVGRGQAAQKAVDQILAAGTRRVPAAAPTQGWIHFGPCGGELVRLQGKKRPICTRCAREVF